MPSLHEPTVPFHGVGFHELSNRLPHDFLVVAKRRGQVFDGRRAVGVDVLEDPRLHLTTRSFPGGFYGGIRGGVWGGVPLENDELELVRHAAEHDGLLHQVVYDAHGATVTHVPAANVAWHPSLSMSCPVTWKRPCRTNGPQNTSALAKLSGVSTAGGTLVT